MSAAHSATRFLIALTACLLVLLLTAGWIVRRNIEHTREAARDIADRVMSALQVRPKIIVNHRTLVEQQSEVLQLVTLEKSLTERQHIENSWLHSTKTLEIEADIVLRAGFDFEKPFVIAIDRSGHTLHVTLPPTQILGLDLRDVRFPREEEGFWNKITPEDREAAIRELRLRVQHDARTSGLLRDARTQAEKKLTTLLSTEGRSVVFAPESPTTAIDPGPVSR